MKTLITLALCVAMSMALPADQTQKKVYVEDMLSGSPSRIVNGEESVPHSHPFIVGLLRTGQFTCGGSIISPEWVVTAAHCMEGANIQFEKVLAGAHDRRANEPEVVKVGVAEAIIHEDWDNQLILNDIALLRLETPLEFNDAISSIQIAAERPAAGTDATVIGWGSTNSAFTLPSQVLREVSRPIASFDDCVSYFGSAIDPNIVCLDTNDEQGACNGDSGGPLVVGDELVGAVSFGGSLFCKRSKYGAYTGLPELNDWICENSGVCAE